MLETEGDRYRLFTRRAALLGGLQLLGFSALAARMYYLTIVQGQQYKMLADENRLSLRFIAPMRGRILDRFGEELATNRQDLRVTIIPEQTEDIEATLDALGRILAVSAQEREAVLRQARRQRGFVPVLVRGNLSWEEFARVNVESAELAGVQPAAGTSRYYPDGPAFAHVLGHVGAVSEKELGDDPVLQLPGFKVGKNGVEKNFDAMLRGSAGTRRVEVNASGRIVREVARQDSEAGADLALTLCAPLQRFAARRLGAESASVVTLDAVTGDILTFASTPAFDPNEFSVGISRASWQTLTQDPRKPLIDKALSGQYPPGSTFKMMVALAALEAGVIDPAEKIYCSGKYAYGDNVFHCWRPHGHGYVDMVRSLSHSCDIYYYQVAERVGAAAIAAMARRFGLGEAFEVPLPGQASGLVPDPAWKRRAMGRGWVGGETLILGIGQGYLLATPLQLAVMAARLANGAAAVTPRLLMAGAPLPPKPLGIKPAHLAVVRRGMVEVVNEPTGTAFAARIREPGLSMAGKTGSAQVRRISKAERDTRVLKNEERPWQERDHALFVAYGPVEAPRYAISVIVEHGGGGASVAAPIARDILAETLKHDPSRRAGADMAAVDPTSSREG
ncbi:MAG: penicillin-binding protein 2 [Pseudomonadota bacterium]